jgi:hypothetical protein
MFCLKLSLILNFKNAVLSKTTFRSIFESFDGVLRVKEIYRLGSMDSKIYTLANNAWLWLGNWQNLHFHQNYLCDLHLWKQIPDRE